MSIYFLKAGDSIAFKIGFTDADPAKRMADLQVGCPFKLELFGCTAGTRLEEQALHKLLASYNTIGEWFEPHQIVIETINRAIKDGVPPVTPAAPEERRPKRQNLACEIIDLLGGNSAVAELTGSKSSAVSNWRRFGKFPSNTFMSIGHALMKHLHIDPPVKLWGMSTPPDNPDPALSYYSWIFSEERMRA